MPSRLPESGHWKAVRAHGAMPLARAISGVPEAPGGGRHVVPFRPSAANDVR